ncbi:helix-turn-helix domain-containing protein [Chitinophaga hostae]|uniref:helix-turn-helix domain-containing protein n=1 Tax=Chitinophaga hostae TaxID=2831022 RepID=UPI003F69C215
MNKFAIHEGENVRFLRTVRQFNQKQLAEEMGGNWNQQKVAYWERQPKIKVGLLYQFAAAIQVPIYILQKPRQELAQSLLMPEKQLVDRNPNVKQMHRKINELYHRLLLSQIELYRLQYEEGFGR